MILKKEKKLTKNNISILKTIKQIEKDIKICSKNKQKPFVTIDIQLLKKYHNINLEKK
jgi:hypothetical protein